MADGMESVRKKIDALDGGILIILVSVKGCGFDAFAAKELNSSVKSILKKACAGKGILDVRRIKKLDALLKKREHLTGDIVKRIKIAKNLDVKDKKREREIFANIEKACLDMGVEPDRYIDIYKSILKRSRSLMSG